MYSVQVEQSDSSYMPSVVAVLAGNSIGLLKEIKQVSVSSTCRECILVSGLTEVRGGGYSNGVPTLKSIYPLSCTILHELNFEYHRHVHVILNFEHT